MKAISFTGDMARAIAEGRKSSTRRIVRMPKNFFESVPFVGCATFDDYVLFTDSPHPYEVFARFEAKVPYKPGDKLWVREPAKIVSAVVEYFNARGVIRYSDGELREYQIPQRLLNKIGAPPAWAYNCQGVPNGCIREMARTFLEVTNIRAEKIQDGGDRDFWGEKRWAENPWVWVIEFKRI